MPTDAQYRRLLEFRTALRQFDQWSRRAAEEHGLTHTLHQLLLAIRGSAAKNGPTIGEVAASLLIQHHSATELVDRVQVLGLVDRVRSADDARRVLLRLTPGGEQVLRELTVVHMNELRRLGQVLGPFEFDTP